MPVERWVSMEEICDYLGCSRDTVKKMVKLYSMPACKMERKWKFKISDVDNWMKKNNQIKYEEGKRNV